jgi:hypothetical protein
VKPQTLAARKNESKNAPCIIVTSSWGHVANQLAASVEIGNALQKRGMIYNSVESRITILSLLDQRGPYYGGWSHDARRMSHRLVDVVNRASR